MGAAYYVTMLRGLRVAYLVGPFDTYWQASGYVAPARTLANKLDPWSHFDAFGVTKRTAEINPPGKLNDKIFCERQNST